ncbi:MAG TPA: histidine phosphatase family protein [Acidimicrobiales bacterium]|nr:histidine phosphatase family protein [Acidimicrobiales bacterium]
MPLVTLVRHAKAAAGWDDADPPLDATGQAQAESVAAALGAEPRPLFTSPLRRARATAAALERLWSVESVIDPRVGEVSAPADFDVASRSSWLRGFLAGTYSDAGLGYDSWRGVVLDALRALPDGAVVVSHFVAINAAIGKAWGDDRVVCQMIDNCSRTTLDIDLSTDSWQVVELGVAAATVVN